MKENGLKEKPFSSWKEISAYLGCDERTCLRWEKKHGLPVHRAGSKLSKSLVFAYREELDDWLRRREGTPSQPPVRRRLSPAFLARAHFWVLVVLGVAVFSILVLSKIMSNSSPAELLQPYNFKIERSEFVALDKEGVELWRFDTRTPDLFDSDSYQVHFPYRKGIGLIDRKLPWVKIEDINADGRTEVLFMIHTHNENADTGLYCLDHRGRKLWTYTPGREMTFGTRHFSEDYTLDAVDVIPAGPQGQKRILVLARHIPNFPSYLALLAPDGKTLGEYWNAGRFSDYELIDVDDDGLPLLYVAGTNNEYGRGFLAILDINNLRGCSPQTDEFRCADLPAGSELFYVLFPRTVVDRLEFAPRESIAFIEERKDGGVMAIPLSSRVIFEFDASIRIESVSISDSFREKYRKFQEEGRIPPGLLNEQAMTESLAKGIVYFNGARWSAARTWNMKNKWIADRIAEGSTSHVRELK